MKSKQTIMGYALVLLVVIAIGIGMAQLKASRLNANYGTHYTWYDVMLDVHKRQIEIGTGGGR